MDFMCFLPSELLLKIVFYVNVRDALKSREVSRGWNRTISGLISYWQRVICSPQVGLSSAILERYGPHTSLPSLAAAGLRHRKWIKKCGSQIGTFSDSLDRPATGDKRMLSALTRFTGIQSNATTAGCFLGQGLILTSPQQSPHVTQLSTVSMKVDDYEPLLKLRNQRGSSNLYSLVVWGRATKDFLLVLLNNGEWLCCSHYMNRTVVSWKSELSMSHHRNPHHPVAGSVTHIGCCDRCFLVVCADASSIYSPTWNLHVLKIGQGKATPEVATRRTVLVHLQANESLVQWLLLSKSSQRDEMGFCKEHSLLYQTDTRVVVYRISLNDIDTKMMVETNRVIIPSSDHHSIDPATNLHSVISIRLSADQSLLATLVDPYHLYVWDTKTWDLISAQHLQWTKTRDTDSSLASIIAVGHLYTVISTGNEKLGFNMHIISTHTGELLNERSSKVNWWRKDRMDFVSLVNEDWLNDVFCFNSPLFAYMNCSQSNELVVSYVQFTQLKKAGSVFRRH